MLDIAGSNPAPATIHEKASVFSSLTRRIDRDDVFLVESFCNWETVTEAYTNKDAEHLILLGNNTACRTTKT